MKRITTIIITALAVFVLAGCSKDGGNDDNGSLGPKRDNYVDGYIKPVKLFLLDGSDNYQSERKEVVHLLPVSFIPGASYETYNNGEVFSDEMAEEFRYKHIIRPVYGFEYNDNEFPVIPELVNRYDSLCKAHKDTEYAKTIMPYSGWQFGPATYRRMTIDVTSDTQYDAAHPAGTSLADIIDIRTNSAKEVIESGYDYKVCETMTNYTGTTYELAFGHKLEMPLEQFNREYRKLILSYRIRLNFKTAPDVTSTHRFTVTYRDEDGRVLTATAAPVTLQGKGAE